MGFIKSFITALVSTLVIDYIWLALLTEHFYQVHLGFLLRQSDGALDPIWQSAVMVYLAIALAIVVFVVPKANGKLKAAFGWGALFGALLYGVYDFTNHATIVNWPFQVVVVDVLWGAFLCGTVSLITTFFHRSA